MGEEPRDLFVVGFGSRAIDRTWAFGVVRADDWDGVAARYPQAFRATVAVSRQEAVAYQERVERLTGLVYARA